MVETILTGLSLAAVTALCFGMFFVVRVRKYIGKLPTILIGSENGVWLVWNAVIIYAILSAPQSDENELLTIILIFLLPAYAGLANCAWQGMLYRSFYKRN